MVKLKTINLLAASTALHTNTLDSTKLLVALRLGSAGLKLSAGLAFDGLDTGFSAAASAFILLVSKLKASDLVGSYRGGAKLDMLNELSFVAGVGSSTTSVTALFNAIRNLYYFFYNAGVVGARFYTVAPSVLNADAISLSYASMKNFGRRAFFNATLKDNETTEATNAIMQLSTNKLDFIFLIDDDISEKKLSLIAKGSFFIFGVTSKVESLLFFDNYLMLGRITVELQYYFVELALNALMSGNRTTARASIRTSIAAVRGLLSY